MICGCSLIYGLFIFFPMPSHFKGVLLWLSPGTRGCLSVSKQNWRTKQTAYLLSAAKITLMLVRTQMPRSTHNTQTQIPILLTAEDSMLNIGYSIAVVCIMQEPLFSVYTALRSLHQQHLPSTQMQQRRHLPSLTHFALWISVKRKFSVRNNSFGVNFGKDTWKKNSDRKSE